MPLISLSVKHGRTLDEARARMESTVDEVQRRFATLVERVEWSDDRNSVRLFGKGCQVEMHVDDESMDLTGDIPLLGRVLAKPFVAGLRQIVERNFQKRLT